MTTLSTLVDRTRSRILSGVGETLNTLAAVNASLTTVTLQRTPARNVQPGTIISAGLEDMYVWDVVASTGVCTVIRGYLGSTAATHSAGEIVRINPPFTDAQIVTAMNEELASLSGQGIFRMRTLDFTTSSTGVRSYDLVGVSASDFLEAYELRYDVDSTANTWPLVRDFRIVPGALASEFPSTLMLRVDQAVSSGRAARLLYKARLGLLSALADVVETVTGLEPSAIDLPMLGAIWRLTMPEEIARNRTRSQGDTRRAEEVPPGAKLRAPAGIAQLRARRLDEERAVLAQRWP